MAQCQSIFFHVLVWLLSSQRFSRLKFCFCLRPGCNHLDTRLWYLLFLWICRNFCVVFNRIDHIFDRFNRKFWPRKWQSSWFTDSVRISIPNLKCWKLVVTSNTGPILIFPWIHPFGWEVLSSRGRVYSRQATERHFLKSPVSLVTKYCPTSTTRINPASLQNLLTLFSCESNLIRSSNRCKRRFWCDVVSFFKGTSALISLRYLLLLCALLSQQYH